VALGGRAEADVLVSNTQTSALETIGRHKSNILSARDSALFVDALLNPPAPNERLRAAARRHRAFVDHKPGGLI